MPQSLFLRSFSVKFKCNPVPGRSGTELALSIYRVKRIGYGDEDCVCE